MAEPDRLARKITFPLLCCYGLGTILGAGIYVLIGKVAGSAGTQAPLAFIIAAIVAGVTSLSYCELVSRFPRSGGEAVFVTHGFQRRHLSQLVGTLVIFTGMVSAATLANGFVGYLQEFVAIPAALGICLVIAVMGGIALWGIAESLWVAGIITAIEVGGLVLVLSLSGDALAQAPQQWQHWITAESWLQWQGIFAGAFLAFYAFIGFEDMVSVVEEVVEPRRNMPRAILTALGVATVLYVLIAVVAVASLSIDELRQSSAPIYDLLQRQHPQAANAVALISLIAIVNGVLAQLIMGSRILYGMSDQGQAPVAFTRVNRRKVPWIATCTILSVTLLFALWLPLETLAKTTSFIILVVFTLVNLSLWRVQRADAGMPAPDSVEVRFHAASFPGLGALLCLTLLGLQILNLLT